ncbi:MAG: hypothetical protein C5B52_07855 [Bacteroidetes bacterium]|nr:MAG: hypothetical protein C5B52_07855 [Bacteroidota bacterium]
MTDFSNHIIAPPSDKVVFDSMLDAPHKNLFIYVASRIGIAEWEAIKLVNDFSFDLKNHLKDGSEVQWDGIGTLKAGTNGEIILEARPLQYNFLQPAHAKRVVRANAHHIIRRGDKEVTGIFTRDNEAEASSEPRFARNKKWWLWAVILTAIALVVLLVHAYSTGFSAASLQNQQGVDVKEAPGTYTIPQ